MTLYTPRDPLHEPGGFVRVPTHTPRTSRWRSGPTSFGRVGRIVCTLVLAALFPWWGFGGFNPSFLWALAGWVLAAVFVLRSVWKPERILDRHRPGSSGSEPAIPCWEGSYASAGGSAWSC